MNRVTTLSKMLSDAITTKMTNGILIKKYIPVVV